MSAFVLKLIAIIVMVVDHIAHVYGQNFTGILFTGSLTASHDAVAFMRIIGRLTFPIMAFFVAEGCRKTSSIQKYMVRLFGFAMLSQIPFTLASDAHNRLGTVNGFAQFGTHLTILDIGSLNVLFTLGLGVLAIYLFEKYNRRTLSCILAGLVIIAGGLLNVDYSFLGVLLVFTAYVFPTRKTQLLGMAVVLSVLYLWFAGGLQSTLNILSTPRPVLDNIVSATLYGFGQWLAALSSLLLLNLYNGERGKKVKYLFYAFYPAHFLILAAIREIARLNIG